MDNPETQVILKNKMMRATRTFKKGRGVNADASCIGLGCLLLSKYLYQKWYIA